MFPIRWNDIFRKKDGTLGTMENVGGSDLPSHDSGDAGKVLTVGEDGELEWEPPSGVTYMTQSQWDALTFAQKKAAGFTPIGTDTEPMGVYYNLSDVSDYWRRNPDYDNVVDISLAGDFDFHGFVCNTIGDKLESSARGGSLQTTNPVFVCNALSTTNYGGLMVLGLTSQAVTLADPSYYGEFTLLNSTLKCGTLTGSWSNNKNVKLTHNDVEQNLATIFSDSNVYTIKPYILSGTNITIPQSHLKLFPIIEDILNNY